MVGQSAGAGSVHGLCAARKLELTHVFCRGICKKMDWWGEGEVLRGHKTMFEVCPLQRSAGHDNRLASTTLGIVA